MVFSVLVSKTEIVAFPPFGHKSALQVQNDRDAVYAWRIVNRAEDLA
jgi:hypothetical protein